ncbi:MAG: hypothetical protein WCO55_05120 [Candidatus Falkowbacteria bacterium]
MIPCYFDMRWDDADGSLVFDVSTVYVDFYRSLTEEQLANVARRYSASYKFFARLAETGQEARNVFGDYFGYGQTVVTEDKGLEFWRLRAKIPDGIVYDHKAVCQSCGGSKIDQDHLANFGRDYPCNICAGSGVKATKQYDLVNELDDNICLLFKLVMMLSYNCEQISDSKRPMLMFLQLGNEGYGRQGIGGYYTKEVENCLLDLLAKDAQGAVEDAITERMFKTYNLMRHGQNTARLDRRCEFQTSIVKGHGSYEKDASIYLQVPGVNSCSVYSDSLPAVYPPKNHEKIYSLTCHNIDHDDQQLALVVGLAYLTTLVRTWLEQ